MGLSDEFVEDTPWVVGPLLRRAHVRAARAFSAALQPLGIEGRHFGVLAILARHGPRTQRDLVDQVGSDRVSMMRIVDDLESRELATRRSVPGDRRLRAVELTTRGHEVFRDAEKAARATSEALLAHLETSERSALTALLARFLDPGHADEEIHDLLREAAHEDPPDRHPGPSQRTPS